MILKTNFDYTKKLFLLFYHESFAGTNQSNKPTQINFNVYPDMLIS